jgi:hypothetical protein
MLTRFDWYQATVHGVAAQAVCDALLRAADLVDLAPSIPRNGYESGARIARGTETLAKIWHGGNPGVHVVGTGEHSPYVAEVLRELGPHFVTRADVCIDWVEPGLFDRLAYGAIAYAMDHGLTIDQKGDWERGKSRTLYVGSPKAAVRLVIYEKGWELGGDPAWVRLEVRVRPEKREQRLKVSTLPPDDLLGASQWLRGLLKHIGLGRWAAASVTKPWRPSEAERARAHCLAQYGSTLRDWAAELGGWEHLGLAIIERLESPP